MPWDLSIVRRKLVGRVPSADLLRPAELVPPSLYSSSRQISPLILTRPVPRGGWNNPLFAAGGRAKMLLSDKFEWKPTKDLFIQIVGETNKLNNFMAVGRGRSVEGRPTLPPRIRWWFCIAFAVPIYALKASTMINANIGPMITIGKL